MRYGSFFFFLVKRLGVDYIATIFCNSSENGFASLKIVPAVTIGFVI